jgi:hypothetical protein
MALARLTAGKAGQVDEPVAGLAAVSTRRVRIIMPK